MTIVYAIMWLLIALFLFNMGRKDSKLYTIFSLYFLFDAVWWFVSYFVQADMFSGALGWVFKGVTIFFLAVGVVYYVLVETKRKGDVPKVDADDDISDE